MHGGFACGVCHQMKQRLRETRGYEDRERERGDARRRTRLRILEYIGSSRRDVSQCAQQRWCPFCMLVVAPLSSSSKRTPWPERDCGCKSEKLLFAAAILLEGFVRCI